MSSILTLDRYVGLPWQERGRTRAGLDCYGLARLVLAESVGIELPDFSDDYEGSRDSGIAILVDGARPDWQPVPAGAALPFDLILFRAHPWHLGVIVRRGWMLHMPERQTSVIEQYTTGRHARRVEGTYRHAARGTIG